jgi:hypothetical protein
MSQVSAQPSKLLSGKPIMPAQGMGRTLSLALMVIGAVCLLATVVVAFTASKDAALPVSKIALGAYHVGFLFVTGISLGALAFVMILHQVNAGWSALLRRQVEHVMSMLFPLCAILFVPILISVFVAPGKLWHWMDPAVAGDLIYQQKQPFLNIEFFTVRSIAYFGVWSLLAMALYRWSLRQDSTADRWLTAKARKLSAIGLLLYAFSTAFAAFDWMMALDYHWFSTMFGVYFFAGNFGAMLATVILILLALRKFASFDQVITSEHLHDMGKLLFGFVVFWAYIGFSQYFLIWYANIPEETAWFLKRRTAEWYPYSIALAVCRFVIPFIILMPRPFRRSPLVLSLMCVWLLGCHMLDLFWVVRPEIGGYPGPTFTWVDGLAIAGPVLLWAGLLVRKITGGPLTPTNDPRLAESLRHKNYI